MTSINERATACRPPLDGPLLRTVFEVPPPLRLDDVGALCPLDDMVLIRVAGGWTCPSCGAAWCSEGRDGRWPGVDQITRWADQSDGDGRHAGRLTRAAVVGVAAAGPAAVTVAAAHRYAEHASAVPEQLVYSPVVAVGLVGVVLASRRVARWVDDRRHPLAVDVDEADLDALGRELLAQVRARRGGVS
ncbi:hypothetical protein JNW91_18795 [Micromonospora sp. STR1_7]|uniref:Uncharacterized protein n=1 Tax=Micromonospora parastrephiae TaxID=2806101 RepID=A0ABS1XWU4_9ACTN|nr:hypothetical protein [Micromonospora parastrephiae]MBM0233718.1 hypothetical protein [Micromonospora parastrephiae]